MAIGPRCLGRGAHEGSVIGRPNHFKQGDKESDLSSDAEMSKDYLDKGVQIVVTPFKRTPHGNANMETARDGNMAVLMSILKKKMISMKHKNKSVARNTR